MLLSEELRKLSEDSLPQCVEEKFKEVESELRSAAQSALTSCEIRFSKSESHLVSGVVARLQEQGFKIEEPEVYTSYPKFTVAWG
jgi:hypothetical protein